MKRNKGLVHKEGHGSERSVELDRRLMEEINILKLEGTLFCFDPRKAKGRRGALTLTDARKQPVTVDVHPAFGQPSVLAYKVLQAIFLKLTEQGCEATEDGRCLYSDSVSFSQRELSRLTSRSVGGRQSRQLYDAIMQLQSTKVVASIYDKASDAWQVTSFMPLISALFAGRGETLTRCAVQLHPVILASLNRRHVAFFNLHRLNQLDTLGLVLYKRVFFHLSNLMHDRKRRDQLKFWKDYESICTEWLGGLKPLRYRSDIIKDQLGRHLEALKATGLISRYLLEKNAAGDGFNLTFYAGQGFFEDYEAYYCGQVKPRRLTQAAELSEVKALELVAYFHRQTGRLEHNQFQTHETSYAEELLATHSEAELRDLIDYAVGKAKETKFEMLFFGALKRYVPEWSADQARAGERKRQARAVRSCPLCNEAGYLELRHEGTNEIRVHPCPHQAERVQQLEEHLRAYRI